MQHMNLDDAPLGIATDSPVPERARNSSRTSSSGTAFRITSGNTPTARRVSGAPKQPLGVDLTFGNSPSTVQRFKRITSGERRQALRSNPPPNQNSFHPNPSAATFRPSPPSADLMFEVSDVNNENEPPEPEYPPMPVTKDALYGRRAYSKVLDGVFQEAYADTGSSHQREAMGRVASAWAQLDEIDPQGEFMLLKAMVDRLKADSKLAAALGIETPAPPSVLKRNSTQGSDTSYGGTTVHGNGTTRIRSNTKLSTSSISKSSASEDYDSPSTPNETPNGTPIGTAGSPTKGGAKLVLAQNNPHLKSHRRRQSAFVVGEKHYGNDSLPLVDEKKLPGHVEKGMEQQGILAEVLYGQWMNGLRSRWPLAN